jgi:type II secretory pathway component PulM
MIRILQSISARERTMLGAVVIVCLLIWLSSLISRAEITNEQLHDAQKTIRQQNIWLESGPIFQAQFDQAVSQIDATKMLGGTELSTFIDSYARKNKLKYEMTTPSVRSGKLYSKASMRVSLNNIPLEDLIKFQIELNAKRPYITVEAIALLANRSDPRLLTARLNLSSLAIHSDHAPKS